MKKLACEMCGSTNLVKEEGIYACQSCGAKYSPEEAKKMMVEGTVKIDDTSKIQNLEKLAKRALENEQFDEAYKYYDKILESEPDNWEAIFNKSLSKAWQSTLMNNMIPEVVSGSKDAISLIQEKEFNLNLNNIKENFAEKINLLCVAFINLSMNHYSEFSQLESSVSEYWDRLAICINVGDYALDLLNENKEQSSKNLKRIILENMIIWCVEISAVRYFTNDYGHTQSIELQNTFRNNFIEIYDKCVELIQEDEKNYKPPIINRPFQPIENKKEDVKNEKNGGCYIATSVYGSYDCPEVWTLRRFRDNTLSESIYGRLFIKIYYIISPSLVKLFGNKKLFKKLLKTKLDKFINKLQDEGVESTYYLDK